MSHSKPGLNEPFYKWLDDVRRAIRKEKELKEKLAYFNVKLIGYKGVVYDRIGSAGTSSREKDLYYWMDKIAETQNALDRTSKLLMDFNGFIALLSDIERQVLHEETRNNITNNVKNPNNKSSITSIKGNIARKWMEFTRYFEIDTNAVDKKSSS